MSERSMFTCACWSTSLSSTPTCGYVVGARVLDRAVVPKLIKTVLWHRRLWSASGSSAGGVSISSSTLPAMSWRCIQYTG